MSNHLPQGSYDENRTNANVNAITMHNAATNGEQVLISTAGGDNAASHFYTPPQQPHLEPDFNPFATNGETLSDESPVEKIKEMDHTSAFQMPHNDLYD